jgi:hypothetical protein
MLNKKLVLVIVVSVLALFLGSKFVRTREPAQVQVVGDNGEKVVVYKSQTCGCCVSYIAYLKKNGFDVETEIVNDPTEIKNKYNIPHQLQSCHTAVIGDYFVEGHMPIEIIYKLLGEKPNIAGISLPAMPAGSPGMPGIKTGDFIIYSLKDGISSEFARI